MTAAYDAFQDAMTRLHNATTSSQKASGRRSVVAAIGAFADATPDHLILAAPNTITDEHKQGDAYQALRAREPSDPLRTLVEETYMIVQAVLATGSCALVRQAHPPLLKTLPVLGVYTPSLFAWKGRPNAQVGAFLVAMRAKPTPVHLVTEFVKSYASLSPSHMTKPERMGAFHAVLAHLSTLPNSDLPISRLQAFVLACARINRIDMFCGAQQSQRIRAFDALLARIVPEDVWQDAVATAQNHLPGLAVLYAILGPGHAVKAMLRADPDLHDEPYAGITTNHEALAFVRHRFPVREDLQGRLPHAQHLIFASAIARSRRTHPL